MFLAAKSVREGSVALKERENAINRTRMQTKLA